MNYGYSYFTGSAEPAEAVRVRLLSQLEESGRSLDAVKQLLAPLLDEAEAVLAKDREMREGLVPSVCSGGTPGTVSDLRLRSGFWLRLWSSCLLLFGVKISSTNVAVEARRDNP